jgi:hypothetical protein
LDGCFVVIGFGLTDPSTAAAVPLPLKGEAGAARMIKMQKAMCFIVDFMPDIVRKHPDSLPRKVPGQFTYQ